MADDAGDNNETTLWSGWYRTWLPRAAYVTAVILAVVYGTTWIFRNTSGFLVTILISLFAAFAMLPAVEALSRRGWRRGLATGTVMLATAAFTVVFVYALFDVAISQTIKLVGQAPEYVDSVVEWANSTFNLELSSDTIIDDLVANEERLQELSLSLIHISEPTRPPLLSRMPSSA
mgnify:CR=1 FL=1